MFCAIAVENDLLDQMLYASGAKDTPKQACLPGTRSAIINEITDWINLPNTKDVPRAFWLHGVAGSGKSALALTICDQFDSINLLGSVFFFDKSFPDRAPSKLFSTISRDIANLVPEWGLSLAKVLHSSHAVRTTSAVKEQWERFILEPAGTLAKSTSPPRRIVIVIDGVDEAMPSPARKLMLTMFEELEKLPSMFRVLITSRPDNDICTSLHGKEFIFARDMGTIDDQSSSQDIDLYIRHHLNPIDDLTVRQLVDKSAHHFQWIATTCRFINDKEFIPEYGTWQMRHKKRLNLVLQSDQAFGLDGLYTTILTNCLPGVLSDLNFRRQFQVVLGQVLHLRQPLTLNAHTDLRGDKEDPAAIFNILHPLNSLLQGVSSNAELPVRPLHTSFRDYLMSGQQSGQFCIEGLEHFHRLAGACLRVMQSLKFNICHLESSYLCNDQVSDLDARIRDNISEALHYACLFWSHHVINAPYLPSLITGLQAFLENKFLFWLEVMSFLKEVNLASTHLQQLHYWAQVSVYSVGTFDKASDLLSETWHQP